MSLGLLENLVCTIGHYLQREEREVDNPRSKHSSASFAKGLTREPGLKNNRIVSILELYLFLECAWMVEHVQAEEVRVLRFQF